MADNYILPQALVFQEITPLVEPVIRPLRAMVFGPNYDLKRYSVAAEKANVALGDYDPTTETCYAWPERPVGGIVDQDWTRLFMDTAWLKYWSNPSQIRKDTTYANRVRATAVNFVTYKTWARDTTLLYRDVRVGDGVRVRGGAADVETYVTGFVNEIVASSVGAAAADVSNQGAASAASSATQTGGTANNVAAVASGTLYNGMVSGHITETYVVEVTLGSTGGSAPTARLSVTAASGTDNQLDVVPAAFAAPTAIGTRGLTATFSTSGGDEFVVGQRWTIAVTQAFVVPAATKHGTYVGPQDSTYIITVSKGGGYTSSPEIMVTTNNGIDTGGPYIVTGSGDQIQVGNYGVKVSFATGTGLVKGDRFLIAVVAEQPGAIKTLILANTLPVAMTGIDLTLDLFIRKNIEVSRDRIGYAPLTNFNTNLTEICVEAGIIGYDSSWYGVGGTLLPMDVYKGTLYVQYRSLLQTHANYVETMTSVSSIIATLGAITPDNPLAYGVFKASENSNGTSVKFMAVRTDDLAGYSFVLEQLVGRDDVYGLVPLTQDRQIQDMVDAHVDAMSSPENGRWRTAWLNSEAQEEQGIVVTDHDGNPAMATVTDPTAGTDYTYVQWVDGTFLTDGVRPGDIYRANYQSDGFGRWVYEEYVIDQVISEDSLRLMAGPAAPINVASKFETWRNLTKSEVASAYALVSGSFGDRRVRHVWPDWITSADVNVQGIFLCCSLAGLRSGVAPHQGLTNVEIAGYTAVPRSLDYFGATELNTMAAAGTWIVTQDTETGQVYTRHQLTTADYNDLNQREDSITTNLDSISYYLLSAFKVYIGKSNISPSFLNQLRADLKARLADLQVETNPNLGPQILDAQIVELRQHSVLKDRVVARVNLVLPYPFNNFEIHLVI